MATAIPTVHKARSDIMVGRRLHDPEREAKGRRDYAAAKLQATIERELAKAPPLTPAQIKRLSALLRSGGAK